MMTSAHVVETSLTAIDVIPSQNYPRPDDQAHKFSSEEQIVA